jgi:DNA-binding MarR family transcriptional regulator
MDDENAEVVSLPQAPDAIELRHLRAFVAVADELNFGRAAARLYLSQPALSRQIRSLERLVGCDLLRRSTHRVELTLAGEALLDRARGLLRDVDEAVSDPLLEEARELTDHAQDCGVDARFELFAVDTHDFHIFWSFLPEAAQALQQAGRFARETTLAAQAG